MPKYARLRNRVQPGHPHVSRLSAALRHRLLLEEEVIAAALNAHPFASVEKFVQEVLWRTYWKGWLERRPGVWADFKDGGPALSGAKAAMATRALEGESGQPAMDRLATELLTTGYLHNHARMWWAAYWIHALGLPWQAGAGHFLRHLLDADPASNTLSWRWVAGLQTPGKTYLLRKANVRNYLEGAEAADLDGLPETPQSRMPRETANLALSDLESFPPSPPPSIRTGLLLHADDLSPEVGELASQSFVALASLEVADPDTPAPRAEWLHSALCDARLRMATRFGQPVPILRSAAEAQAWAGGNKLTQVVAYAPFQGSVRSDAEAAFDAFRAAGAGVVLLRRPWDSRFFALARDGFFPFWKRASSIVRQWQAGC
jgi:hypothetical protein